MARRTIEEAHGQGHHEDNPRPTCRLCPVGDWRAVCLTCKWGGNIERREVRAWEAAGIHRLHNSGHDVRVEFVPEKKEARETAPDGITPCSWCGNEGGARLLETKGGECPKCGRL